MYLFSIDMKIYALYHIYDETVDQITYKEVKRIGYFDTKEECESLIRVLKHMLNSEIILSHVLRYLSMK